MIDVDNEEFYSNSKSDLIDNSNTSVSLSSKQMYIQEICKYPLLSSEKEKYYCEMLKNKEDNKLLIFNDGNNFNIPTLNTNLLFISLCNSLSYESVINDLLLFYNNLDSSNDKTINILKKYQKESGKILRALNLNELQNIFNISYNKKDIILSEKDLLIEIKKFMNYKLAFKKMFESNLRLVVSIARKYQSNIEEIDLIQEGNLGLIKAIIGFDMSLGYKFSTYATACIKQSIRRYMYNNNSSIKMPEYLGNNIYFFKKKVDQLIQREKRELLPVEISIRLNMPIETVQEYLKYLAYSEVSIDKDVSDTKDITMKDAFKADIDIEEIVASKTLEDDIEELLDILDDRYKDIVKMKFGLGEYKGQIYTTCEIGKKHSISSQRVTEIFHRSLYLMKRATKSKAKHKALIEYSR